MAKTLKDLIKNSKKIGHYTEATGGGTPLAKGEKLKNHPEAKRVMQPRDEEGRFAHNSVNMKPLKFKSRGKTVPAFLRGTKVTYAQKSGSTSLVDEGNKRYKMPTGIETAEQLIKAMTYANENGTFSGISLDEVIGAKGGKIVDKSAISVLGFYLNEYKIKMKNSDEIFKKENITKVTLDWYKSTKEKVDTDTIDLEKVSKDKEYFYKTHDKEIGEFIEKFKKETGEETTKEEIFDIIVENKVGSFTELNELFEEAIK